MDSYKIVVKFFLQGPSASKLDEVVPVFHGWIRDHAILDHLLVDVADYQHVHHGPGIVLVAHEANFAIDDQEGRRGLFYQRKTPVEGDFRDALRTAFSAALSACARLEDDPALEGKVRFKTDEALFRIADRLLAPPTQETWEDVKPQLERFVADLFGVPVKLEPRLDPQKLFEVRITAPGAPSVKSLQDRLNTVAVT